jgi:hypothetical protein
VSNLLSRFDIPDLRYTEANRAPLLCELHDWDYFLKEISGIELSY